MPFKFSKRSLENLENVHPDLVKLCNEVIKYVEIDFIITDGDRTIEEQREFVRTGASQTMNSRHLHGHAIDFVALVNRRASYEWEHMKKIADCFKTKAKELGIEIEWGGDWKHFKDSPHIQLKRNKYPDPETVDA